MKIHHTALVTRDIEAALAFYRDGLGMQVILDIEPRGDFTTLFNANSDRLHSIFLADASDADGGILELVELDGIDDPPPAPPEQPRVGFFLISFYVDFDAVTKRLEDLGYPLHRQIEIAGRHGQARMGTVRDPDGVLVELIGLG